MLEERLRMRLLAGEQSTCSHDATALPYAENVPLLPRRCDPYGIELAIAWNLSGAHILT
jgi:hypothetical protein